MNQNFIILINGSGTSGKDTVVDLVYNNFLKFYNVYNISSIDKVREAAKILGWSGTKDDHDREFLHRLKMLSSEFYNHSLGYMLESLKDFESPYIAFFHIREPEELSQFKDLLNSSPSRVFTLLVERNNIKKFNNDADKNVANYKYDFIIENNGSKYDLECKTVKLFSKILRRQFNG